MRRLFNRTLIFTKSEFALNASKLMTGSILSQILSILAAPVLSRIYSPADYGVLGLYMSVTGMIAMFGTLQYSSAIVIAKNEEEVRGLIKLCLQILSIFTFCSFAFIVLLHEPIGYWLKSSALSRWLWLAPLSVFMSGLSGIFGNYAIRHKQFTLVSANRVLASVGATLCSIAIGYFLKNPLGLFVGLWVSQLISGLSLAIQAIRQSGESWMSFVGIDTNQVKKQFVSFPKYSLPADFINNFTNQVPLFMLNAFGSIAAVGSFNMSNRILGLPIGFISSAFGEVFRQKAAKDYVQHGTCRPVFVKTFKTLSLLSIVPFAIIILFGSDIFAFVLGEKWREAGTYAQIMGVMFFFRFTVSPLTYVYYIANKQKEDFYLHLLFLLISYSSFNISYKYTGSTSTSLFIYSILYSAIYLIYLTRSYHFSMANKVKNDSN